MAYTISALARLSGISPAVLRRFDHDGIVVPERVGGARHRRYTDSDIQRLQRALSLQRFGLSSSEIRTALDMRTDIRVEGLAATPSQDAPVEPSTHRLLGRMNRLCGEGIQSDAELPQLLIGEYIATVSNSPEPSLESVEGLAERARAGDWIGTIPGTPENQFPAWLGAGLQTYAARRIGRVELRPVR